MSKSKLPPEDKRNDACNLFRVLRSLSAYVKGRDEYDSEAGEIAAMVLLSRLGLAAPIPDDNDDDDDDEDVSWVLTVEGNEKLAELLTELRQWDPSHLVREARRRRVQRQS
jgi:hypothetical protein